MKQNDDNYLIGLYFSKNSTNGYSDILGHGEIVARVSATRYVIHKLLWDSTEHEWRFQDSFYTVTVDHFDNCYIAQDFAEFCQQCIWAMQIDQREKISLNELEVERLTKALDDAQHKVRFERDTARVNIGEDYWKPIVTKQE